MSRATPFSEAVLEMLYIGLCHVYTVIAARLVLSARKYEHVTSLLRDLHWQRVPERIEFKLAVLVFHCLHGTAPAYLADEL